MALLAVWTTIEQSGVRDGAVAGHMLLQLAEYAEMNISLAFAVHS